KLRDDVVFTERGRFSAGTRDIAPPTSARDQELTIVCWQGHPYCPFNRINIAIRLPQRRFTPEFPKLCQVVHDITYICVRKVWCAAQRSSTGSRRPRARASSSKPSRLDRV